MMKEEYGNAGNADYVIKKEREQEKIKQNLVREF